MCKHGASGRKKRCCTLGQSQPLLFVPLTKHSSDVGTRLGESGAMQAWCTLFISMVHHQQSALEPTNSLKIPVTRSRLHVHMCACAPPPRARACVHACACAFACASAHGRQLFCLEWMRIDSESVPFFKDKSATTRARVDTFPREVTNTVQGLTHTPLPLVSVTCP